MLIEKLVHLGLATISLGTIYEADGVKERPFWLCNDGDTAVTLVQGYTSCGCTTIRFDKEKAIAPGDSTCVWLAFNPRGKGGEFYESGTIVYGGQRGHIEMAMTGVCVTSEETLMRQFPVYISESLRITAERFDLGIMPVGTSKQLNIVALHRDDNDRQEQVTIKFFADQKIGKGLHHVPYTVTVRDKGKEKKITIMLDVLIK